MQCFKDGQAHFHLIDLSCTAISCTVTLCTATLSQSLFSPPALHATASNNAHALHDCTILMHCKLVSSPPALHATPAMNAYSLQYCFVLLHGRLKACQIHLRSMQQRQHVHALRCCSIFMYCNLGSRPAKTTSNRQIYHVLRPNAHKYTTDSQKDATHQLCCFEYL